MNKPILSIGLLTVAAVTALGFWLNRSSRPPAAVPLAESVAPSGAESQLNSLAMSVRKGTRLPAQGRAAANVRLAPNPGATSGPHPEPSEEDDEDVVIDQSPRQAEWRKSYVEQRQDDEWTKRMLQQLRARAQDILDDRTLAIHDLSCRETICRMYLQFEDQLDAQAFQESIKDLGLQHEFQCLDPAFQGEGFDRSDNMYEVMFERARPADLQLPEEPALPLPPGADSKNAAVAKAGAGVTIVTAGNSE